MLIRNLGNCGNFAKLERICKALDIAKKNQTQVVIVLDELVYGKNMLVITEVKNYDFNKTNIIVNDEQIPWWDITKVNLIF